MSGVWVRGRGGPARLAPADSSRAGAVSAWDSEAAPGAFSGRPEDHAATWPPLPHVPDGDSAASDVRSLGTYARECSIV